MILNFVSKNNFHREKDKDVKKEEYISLLKQQLKGLEDTEIQDAVGYVEEYFDEAQDDAQVLQDLGAPDKFATHLKTESVLKKDPRTYQSPHKLIKNITIILGGIFGLPIALPLLLCIIVVLFCMVLVIFLMILSLIIATIALLYGAAASLCVGFIYAQGIGDIFMHVGASLILLGLGLFAYLISHMVLKKGIPFFIRICDQIYHRFKQGGIQHEN